jgi:hypothetical protein
MKNLTISIITFLIFNLNAAFAQYEIQYPQWYPTTQFKSLYIISPDTSTVYCKEVIKIVNDNWSLCPVKLWQGKLAYIDENLLIQGNLFLQVRIGSKENTVIKDNGSQGTTTTNDYYHLDIMALADKYNPKKSVYESLLTIARGELYNRKIGMGGLSWEAKGDFTSELFQNDFCNGMKGNIKNMIQYFNNELPKNKTIKLMQDQTPTNELSNLKKETLYVPNYWYGGKGTMLEDEKETSSVYKKTAKYIEKMLTAYPYKVKLITREELNNLILTADTNVYYLNYIQSSADKIISVTNGLNGNVIYTQVTKISYRIKDSDLENIGKAIK